MSNACSTALFAEMATKMAPSGCTLKNEGIKVIPFAADIPHFVWHSNLCWTISISSKVPTINQDNNYMLIKAIRNYIQTNYVNRLLKSGCDQLRLQIVPWPNWYLIYIHHLPSALPRTTILSVMNAWHVIWAGIGDWFWPEKRITSNIITKRSLLHICVLLCFIHRSYNHSLISLSQEVSISNSLPDADEGTGKDAMAVVIL